MPPKARTNSKNSVEQEGRVLLAVSALKKKEILNIHEAAHVYNVPYYYPPASPNKACFLS
jgi:hypothetical protein